MVFKFSEYFSHENVFFEKTMLVFEKCILKKSIGDFKQGHKFSIIEFMCAEMELCFYDDKDNLLMIRYFNLTN